MFKVGDIVSLNPYSSYKNMRGQIRGRSEVVNMRGGDNRLPIQCLDSRGVRNIYGRKELLPWG